MGENVMELLTYEEEAGEEQIFDLIFAKNKACIFNPTDTPTIQELKAQICAVATDLDDAMTDKRYIHVGCLDAEPSLKPREDGDNGKTHRGHTRKGQQYYDFESGVTGLNGEKGKANEINLMKMDGKIGYPVYVNFFTGEYYHFGDKEGKINFKPEIVGNQKVKKFPLKVEVPISSMADLKTGYLPLVP